MPLTTVETVRGPVELDRLGPTLMHEHVFILDPEARENWSHLWGPAYWDEDAGVANAIEKLRRLRARGIETIVDATAYGSGRNIPRIERVNAGVDLKRRRRDRVLRIPRAPELPQLPERRLDRRALRSRAPRRHRRHRCQGGIPQVRRRGAS